MDEGTTAGSPGRQRPHVLEIQLSRFYFPDDEEEPVRWSAEWGLRDDQRPSARPGRSSRMPRGPCRPPARYR